MPCSGRLFGFDQLGGHADAFLPVGQGFKDDYTFFDGEDRPILTHHYVQTRADARAVLADDDIAREDIFARVFFNAQALTI